MKILALFGFGVLLSFLSPRSYANCGSSSCPIDHHSYVMPGMFRIGLSYENIKMDKLQFGTELISIDRIPVPVHHEELETINHRTVLNVDYGVSSRLSFNFMAPYIVREHSHLEEGQLQHWSFSGIGDIMFHGSYVISQSMNPDVPYLAVTAGIKLPTGATNRANDEGEEAEVTIQPGTGSYDGVLSLNGRYVVGSLKSLGGAYTAIPITASVTARANSRGKNDYRIGNEIVGSLGSSFELDPRILFQLQLNLKYQGYGDMGTTDEYRAYTGGTWMFLTPGVGSEIASNVNFFLFLQIPLYQNVHGVQQVSSMNIQAGISYNGNFF